MSDTATLQQIESKNLETQVLMSEENITLGNLPKELQNKVRSLNLELSRYNKSMTHERLDKLLLKDISIADEIADHIENGLPPEPPTEPIVDTPPANPDAVVEPVVAPVVEPTPPVVEPAKTEPVIKTPKGFGTLEMEQAILEILSKNNGKIYESELHKIIGKSPSKLEHIHNIKLKLHQPFLDFHYQKE